MTNEGEKKYVAIEKLKSIRGLRFTSGKSVYEEALENGRLIVRFWNPGTHIENNNDINAQSKLVQDWALESFGLNIDGQSLIYGWQWKDFSEASSQKKNIRHGILTLYHPLRKIELKIHMFLDGSPFMQRWLEVKNCSEKHAALSSIIPWSGNLFWTHYVTPCGLGYDESPYKLGYFTSCHWGEEGFFKWIDLPLHPLAIESNIGASGHSHPFFIIKDTLSGRCAMAQLAWSGNWRAEFSARCIWPSDVRLLFFSFGPKGASPLRVIAPGESVKSPRIHLAVMEDDLDGCIQNLHMHIRRSVLPAPAAEREARVICNLGIVTDETTEEKLLEQIDIAADVGCEVCIIDAGWYGSKGSIWPDQVGDWRPGDRLPNGFDALRERIHKREMLFGLWVEIECAGAASELLKEHPDWALKNGAVGVTGGRQLDLAKKEVAEWVESEITRIVEEYKIDLFRLDYNTRIFEGGHNERDGFLENSFYRHYEALYGIFDRVRKKYPHLLLENCASGGARTDIGMVSRFDTTWVSDWMGAPRSAKILNGMTVVLPPERINRLAGTGGGINFKADLDFQMRIPLFGHFAVAGIAPSRDEIHPEKIEKIKYYIKLYKEFIRPMLSRCRVYHHTPVLPGRDPAGYCVLEYVSEDASRAYAGIFRLLDDSQNRYHFKSRGLDLEARYKVTFCNSGSEVEMSGADLQLKGLDFSFEKALTSELLLFERI